MARGEIRQTIYNDLRSHSALLALLGPVTTDNLRIYSGWPQTPPQLSSIEPDEGWLVVYEPETLVYWQTVQQHAMFDFIMTVTRSTLGDDVIDILDDLYHWKLGGQNSRLFGEWNVIRSARLYCKETYMEPVKLFQKTARYKFYISGLGVARRRQ